MLVKDFFFYISMVWRNKVEFSKIIGIAETELQFIMREKERVRTLYRSII